MRTLDQAKEIIKTNVSVGIATATIKDIRVLNYFHVNQIRKITYTRIIAYKLDK